MQYDRKLPSYDNAELWPLFREVIDDAMSAWNKTCTTTHLRPYNVYKSPWLYLSYMKNNHSNLFLAE